MKNVLIIENDQEDFEVLFNFYLNQGFECFPNPNNPGQKPPYNEYEEFINYMKSYLKTKSIPDYNWLKDRISLNAPFSLLIIDLYIVDEKEGEEEMKGGWLRNNFINDIDDSFRYTPCIFVTKATKDEPTNINLGKLDNFIQKDFAQGRLDIKRMEPLLLSRTKNLEEIAHAIINSKKVDQEDSRKDLIIESFAILRTVLARLEGYTFLIAEISDKEKEYNRLIDELNSILNREEKLKTSIEAVLNNEDILTIKTVSSQLSTESAKLTPIMKRLDGENYVVFKPIFEELYDGFNKLKKYF